MIKILKVTGNSMHPTLASGAFVLVCYKPQYSETDLKTNRMARLSRKLKGFVYQSSLISSNRIIRNKLADRFFSHPMLAKLLSTFNIQQGDIVAVNHPKYGQIIKRVTAIEYVEWDTRKHTLTSTPSTIKRLRLKGDNSSESVTEAQLGWLTPQHIIGKVIYVVET